MSEAIRHGEIFLALSEPPSTAREAHAQTVVRDLIAALRAPSSAPPGEKGERIPSVDLEDAAAAILRIDGDRDWSNKSDMTVEMTLSIVKLLRGLAASLPPAKAEDGMREVDDGMIYRAREFIDTNWTFDMPKWPGDTEVEKLLRAALAKEEIP